MDSRTLYALAKSFTPFQVLDPPDTFLYVTTGLIVLSALLLADSLGLSMMNLKSSSLFFSACSSQSLHISLVHGVHQCEGNPHVGIASWILLFIIQVYQALSLPCHTYVLECPVCIFLPIHCIQPVPLHPLRCVPSIMPVDSRLFSPVYRNWRNCHVCHCFHQPVLSQHSSGYFPDQLEMFYCCQ